MMKKLVGITIAPGAISCRLVCAVSLALALLVSASPAHARLKIRLVSLAGAPPTDDKIVGGGNLDDIMKVAAGAWEDVFRTGSGMWDVTIYYQWTAMGTGWVWGSEQMLAQGGNNPVRITESRLNFNNQSEAAQWFADPTPRDSTEYKRYTSYLWNDDRLNEDVPVNRGRNFTEATGDAAGRIDLLTVAIHEIGHALGLDQNYVGYKCPNLDEFASCGVVITAPRPYAGLVIPMKIQSSHLADDEFFQVDEEKPLMVQDPVLGVRQFISALDALAIAEMSKFDRPNLNATLPLPW